MEKENTSNNSSLLKFKENKDNDLISKEINNNNINNEMQKFNIEYKNQVDKNNTTMKNEKTLQKISNQKVNNTLNDIYGAIATINEVNNRVKNILSKRLNIPKSLDAKKKIINEEKNVNNINNFNLFNIIPKTTKNNSLYNINDKEIKKSDISSTFRTSKKNSEVISNFKKIGKNNSYSINNSNNNNNFSKMPKNNSVYNYDYIKPVLRKEIKVILNPKLEQHINNQLNNELKYNNKNFNCSMESTLKGNDLDNDISCSFYNEEIINEKDIKSIRLKLKKEEKKLKNLEEIKNKLLEEEKIRRNIIMEKIKTKNKIKKQVMIKEYKKKINLIKILQAQNMKEIKQLEKNKKIDERKINQINNSINEQGKDINIDGLINKKIIKIRKKNRRKKRENKNDKNNKLNQVDDEKENNYTYSENTDNDNLKQCYTISNNYNNYIINEDLNNNKNSHHIDKEEQILIEDYNYLNLLYNQKASNRTNNKSKSFSYNKKNDVTPKKNENNLEIYNGSNNDIKNIEKKLDGYKESNKKKKIYYDNYSSDSRKYDKKNIDNSINLKLYQKVVTPKINIPSFIQVRVNKYNHSTSKKSNDSKNSKRYSACHIIPYSLNYNLSHKYKYDNNLPPNISYRNNISKNSDKIESRRSNRNNKDLNYKTIFFN